MENLKIRVYKMTDVDGAIGIAVKTCDDNVCNAFNDLEHAVLEVKKQAKKHEVKAVEEYKKRPGDYAQDYREMIGQVVVDFYPYHRAELVPGFSPRLCEELSEEEELEFWRLYAK